MVRVPDPRMGHRPGCPRGRRLSVERSGGDRAPTRTATSGLHPARPTSTVDLVCAFVEPLAVHHVSINVDDVDAAVDFYVGVLGLRARTDRPDFGFAGAWLDAGG